MVNLEEGRKALDLNPPLGSIPNPSKPMPAKNIILTAKERDNCGRRMSKADRERIVTLKCEGKNNSEVSRLVGFARRHIQRVWDIEKKSIDVQPSKPLPPLPDPVEKPEAYALEAIKRKITKTAICATLGINYKTLQKFLNKLNTTTNQNET